MEAAGALRRRTVHRLLPNATLRFVFNKQVDTARVIVSAYQQNERLVSMHYAIDATQRQEFALSATPMRGEIEGVATEAPGLWYWETGPNQALNFLRGSIPLGTDVAPGRVTLALRNQSRNTAFVALVLVGQEGGVAQPLQRFWTTEEQ
jgi:hypothetical protein